MKYVFAALIAGVFAASSAAFAAGTVFDAPQDTQTRALPPLETGAKVTLTCSYYSHFMVKQIDEGEVGAAQLSIVPTPSGQKPACKRENMMGEGVVDPKDWSGYVKGVKGDFVFFDADDGVNGALGFAVYKAPIAKKLFEDAADGDLKSASVDGGALTLRYRRSFSGECSVPHAGAACWAKIAAAAGVDATVKPDCAGGYLKAKNEMAKGRCEADGKPAATCLAPALKELDAQHWDESPSVILYDVETVIGADGAAKTKALGPALSCHPAD